MQQNHHEIKPSWCFKLNRGRTWILPLYCLCWLLLYWLLSNTHLLDNNLSCCSISHLDDIDALLQAVDLHTIDCVDAFCCIYCRTVLDILDASSYTASTLSWNTQDCDNINLSSIVTFLHRLQNAIGCRAKSCCFYIQYYTQKVC